MKKLSFILLLMISNLLSGNEHINKVTNYKIVADYLFDGHFKSSVSGAPDINFLGMTHDFKEEIVFGVKRTIFNFLVATGFRLDVSSLITDSDYSIAVVFKIVDAERYVKFLDFKNLTTDNGVYNSEGKLIFYPDNEDLNPSIIANQYTQYIITRSSNGSTKGYINGQLQFEFSDLDSSYAIPSNENLLHFFIDDDTTGNSENSDASIARITVFDKALDQQDIQNFPRLDTIFGNSFE